MFQYVYPNVFACVHKRPQMSPPNMQYLQNNIKRLIFQSSQFGSATAKNRGLNILLIPRSLSERMLIHKQQMSLFS